MAGKKTRAPTIAFITTCKGRLHHLKETLPLMAAQQPDELIVVDYDCPDRTGEWVEGAFRGATVVRASQPDGGFNVGRARNLGAAEATSDWLFFVDADVRPMPGLAQWLRGNLRPGAVYRPQPGSGAQAHQIYGSFACTAADFAETEGYDEVIEGWGYEDRDLYVRLEQLGLAERYYPSELVSAIGHGNEERHMARGFGKRVQNWAANACYAEAKFRISLFRGGKGNLPLAERRQLREQSARIIREWVAKGAPQPLRVQFVVRRDEPRRLSQWAQVRSEWTLTIEVAAK